MSAVVQVYPENVLMKPLGEILDRDTILRRLTYRPPVPVHEDIGKMPVQLRRHKVMDVLKLYIPPLEAALLHESLDVSVRQIYESKNPELPDTWAGLANLLPVTRSQLTPAMATVEEGPSGTGKTQAAIRAMCLFPNQVYMHEQFPDIIGRHPQMVWQSASVPPSGKLKDLAYVLMRRWEDTMVEAFGPDYRRFELQLSRPIRDGYHAMSEWKQVARVHGLGLLHLDEVQNFFKLPSVMKRRTERIDKRSAAPIQLSVAEDQCLKYVLELASAPPFALLFSGTSDGIDALRRRLSNEERIPFTQVMAPFRSPTCPMYVEFMEALVPYQYVKRPLENSEELRCLVYRLSAGIRRIIIVLWIAAHRVAFARKNSDELRLSDFVEASTTYLARLRPAVEALLSRDPEAMRMYEDLLPRDAQFWSHVTYGIRSD